ncbi:MAG: hypothetical protein AAF449_19325 [Myxococcota bacterium]
MTLGLSAVVVATACTGAQVAAPSWFTSPAKSDRQFLYFVGDASDASDESTARELAVQKALYELSVYCGADLTTDFKSVEIERNGELNQEVSLTVDVAGRDISIREATTDKWVVGRGKQGFNAFVRLKWPVREYNNVRAAQRDSARVALDRLSAAEEAFEAHRWSESKRLVREAKQAIASVPNQIPLEDPKYPRSGLVFDGIRGLEQRLKEADDRRRRVIAVSISCTQNGADQPCASRWVGHIKQRITQAGMEIATAPVSPMAAKAILGAQTPTYDAGLRASRYVLAVKYAATHSGMQDGFAFARCGARGVMFDTEQNDVLQVGEVKPQKGGHVNFDGAVRKACEKAEAELVAWLEQNIGSKGSDRP